MSPIRNDIYRQLAMCESACSPQYGKRSKRQLKLVVIGIAAGIAAIEVFHEKIYEALMFLGGLAFWTTMICVDRFG